MDIKRFKKLPLMGILRGITAEELDPLLEAVVNSGLKTIEITMNTLHAPELIRKARKVSRAKLTIGAGTVLNKKDLSAALRAGATFIVSPFLAPEVCAYCVKNKIPVFPGALSPQEIYRAWEAGAAMVKVFPAKFFGPGYFKEIKGPFTDIELLACAGVTPRNLKEYFANGANAASFGASVFKKEWLKAKAFNNIGEAVEEYVEAYKKL